MKQVFLFRVASIKLLCFKAVQKHKPPCSLLHQLDAPVRTARVLGFFYYLHFQVMVAEALNISRETYFAILMDRACNGPVMVGSPQGGVDIEEVAVTSPELIFKVGI